jgi:hypothetical protein
MLEPDAGPTRKSGSQRGAGRQRPAPTRQRGLRQPTIGRLIGIAYALGVEPGALVTRTVASLRRQVPL